MRKIFFVLLCLAGMTAYAQFMELLVLEEDESTLEGYSLDENLPAEVLTAYGIEDFGRVKGFDVQRAMSFSGEGEFEDVTDGFQFEFVPKNGGTYGHDIYLGYAKIIYDRCKKAADDGKIYNGFWDGAKERTFEESVKTIDKKQDRMNCNLYYYHKGVKRQVEITERRFTEPGRFTTLFVHMKRYGY